MCGFQPSHYAPAFTQAVIKAETPDCQVFPFSGNPIDDICRLISTIADNDEFALKIWYRIKKQGNPVLLIISWDNKAVLGSGCCYHDPGACPDEYPETLSA